MWACVAVKAMRSTAWARTPAASAQLLAAQGCWWGLHESAQLASWFCHHVAMRSFTTNTV